MEHSFHLSSKFLAKWRLRGKGGLFKYSCIWLEIRWCFLFYEIIPLLTEGKIIARDYAKD